MREKITDPKCPNSDVICDSHRHGADRCQKMVPSSSQAVSSSSQASQSTQQSQPSQLTRSSTRLVDAFTPLKRGIRPIDDHSPEPPPIAKVGRNFSYDIGTSVSSSSGSTQRESELNSTLDMEDENDEMLVMNIPFKTSGISGSSCVYCHVDQ